MGIGHIACMLGFSVHYSNAFSEKLEGRSRQMDEHFREANQTLMRGLSDLHVAVDVALAGDEPGAAAALSRGLGHLTA